MNKWPIVKIGDILTERRESPSPDDLAYGRVRIVSKISFDTGRFDLRSESKTKTGMILAHPGDLLISGINAAKGAIALYGAENIEPIAATIHYSAYTPKPEYADLKYLWWFFRSHNFQEILNQHVPGGIKTELKAKRLLPIPIPLPPLAEQRRIVARIEVLAAQINEAKGLRKQAADDCSIIIKKVFDKRLKDPNLLKLPLRNLLSEPLMNGLSVPASQLGSGVCFAKVGIVNTGVFNPSEVKFVNIELEQNSPYWLQNGDILVSRGNSAELVGRAAVYEGNPAQCAMPDLLIRVRIDSDKADAHFVSAFFHSTKAREYIAAQISGTSSTMPKISQSKLEALPILVPSLSEQRRILAELDAFQAEVDALKRLQAETSAELDALLPAILDRAFKGKL